MGDVARVRVLLLEGDPDLRAVFETVCRLARVPIRVVDRVDGPGGLGAVLASLTPDDVVVLDCSSGDASRLATCSPHTTGCPAALLVVHPRDDAVRAAKDAGLLPAAARRLAPEFGPLVELERLRLTVAAVEAREAAARTGPADLSGLSRREQEVVSLVAEGLSNVDIAEHLELSPGTVKTYVARGKEKLGRESRDELRDAVAGAAESP